MPKILLVEDNEMNRDMLSRRLARRGFEVCTAADGRDGIQQAIQHGPDLILSDWNMPEMSGIQFLQTLRARGDATPFCFVTSEGSEEMREQAAAAGALGLIAKPFTAEAFSDILSSVVTS